MVNGIRYEVSISYAYTQQTGWELGYREYCIHTYIGWGIFSMQVRTARMAVHTGIMGCRERGGGGGRDGTQSSYIASCSQSVSALTWKALAMSGPAKYTPRM